MYGKQPTVVWKNDFAKVIDRDWRCPRYRLKVKMPATNQWCSIGKGRDNLQSLIADAKALTAGMGTPLLVVKVGFSDHGVSGIAYSMDDARRVAEEAAGRERDSYHSFEIRKADENGEYGEMDEPVATFGLNCQFSQKGVRKWEETK